MFPKSTLAKIAIGVVAVVVVFCLVQMMSSKNRASYPEPIPIVTQVPIAAEKFAEYDPDDEGDDALLEEYADYVPAGAEYAAVPVTEEYVDAADVYASPDASGQLLDD